MIADKNLRLFVGTSGYCYNHWGRGIFYPKGVKTRDWLTFYAQHFNTVELNISFYRRPRLEYLQRWAQLTPDGFCFSAKLNRFITHYQKLKSCENQLAADKVLADGLGEKLAVVLAQLPPSFPADLTVLHKFLDRIKSGAGYWIPKLAIEFRHPTWLTDETYRLLNEYDVSVCLADWGSIPVTRTNDASFIYIRRHSGWDNGNYTPEQIQNDTGLIRHLMQQGKIIYLYYNNDANAHAVHNARQILGALTV